MYQWHNKCYSDTCANNLQSIRRGKSHVTWAAMPQHMQQYHNKCNSGTCEVEFKV